MIEEAYVSFETAKLLEEKGFDESTICVYHKDGIFDRITLNNWNNKFVTPICAPTQQMAMRWLREKHNIYISIQPDFPSEIDYKMCWCWSANVLHENCISTKGHQCYIETYEQAVEAAILYTLKNLI